MHLKKLLLLSTLLLMQALHAQQVIDLTYPYDENTIYWPTETGFHLTKESYGMNAKGYFYSALRFSAPEHGGTHIVKGIGIDTASMDPGVETQFWAHRVILGSNRFGLENVAHLDLLPTTGAMVIIAPMKIAGGSGGPTRIFALIHSQ